MGEACEIFEFKKFTTVNDCFKNKRNEVFAILSQTLITFGKWKSIPLMINTL
jgi:hypothetical protein